MDSVVMKLNEIKDEIEIIWKDDVSHKFLSDYICPLISLVDEINYNTVEFINDTDKTLSEILSIDNEV